MAAYGISMLREREKKSLLSPKTWEELLGFVLGCFWWKIHRVKRALVDYAMRWGSLAVKVSLVIYVGGRSYEVVLWMELPVVEHISVTSAFHLSRHPDIQFPPCCCS